MPWKPTEPGEVPTLGWYVIDWITEYLAAPDRGEYEPFVLYPEQEDFVLRFYELDPRTGRRRRRRGVISRSRGWGKSPFLASLAIVEALADVVPDGWDAAGQPVGRPWSTLRTPLVQILAVSEDQTKNTWDPLLEMLNGPVLDAYPGLEPLDTFVNLPRGKMEPKTSSARTVKGNRPVFAVMDQTEEWVKSNGGHNLFEKVKNNTAKTGGSFIESPNAFTPGDDSVAERTAQYWQSIREGRALDDGLYYDHREAPAETDMWQRDSIVAGLRYAYGDSSGHEGGCVLHDPPCPPGHVDIDHLVATIWDSTSDVQVSRADFLNQITYASDSWISQIEWSACGPARDEEPKKVGPTEPVVLGFDGSKSRKRGVADATALVACRVSDGYTWLEAAWEQQDSDPDDWEVPAVEVDAAVADAFKKWNVVGFYADPAKWETYVAAWEARYHKRLKVKAGQKHPIEWWINSGRSIIITRAIDKLHTAIVEAKEFSHDGSLVLTRHMLNARNRKGPSGMWIAKKHPDSSRKIDAAWASVAAYAARVDAIAAGLGRKTAPAIPGRIR